LDWNNVEFKSERFKQIEGEIDTLFEKEFASYDEAGEKLL
jgi:hypothetical protein